MIIKIDLNSQIPIYLQIRNQIVLGIGKGELKRGERLPSVRQLAIDLGINHMTVAKAYNELKDEGLIVVNRSEGTMVRDDKEDIIPEDYMDKLDLILAEGIAKSSDRDEYFQKLEKILDELKKEKD